MDRPHTGLLLGRKTHALQALQTPNQHWPMPLQPGSAQRLRQHQTVHRLSLQSAVQPRPALLVDFPQHGTPDL